MAGSETPREVLDAVREQLRALGCDVECSDELILDFLKHLGAMSGAEEQPQAAEDPMGYAADYDQCYERAESAPSPAYEAPSSQGRHRPRLGPPLRTPVSELADEDEPMEEVEYSAACGERVFSPPARRPRSAAPHSGLTPETPSPPTGRRFAYGASPSPRPHSARVRSSPGNKTHRSPLSPLSPTTRTGAPPTGGYPAAAVFSHAAAAAAAGVGSAGGVRRHVTDRVARFAGYQAEWARHGGALTHLAEKGAKPRRPQNFALAFAALQAREEAARRAAVESGRAGRSSWSTSTGGGGTAAGAAWVSSPVAQMGYSQYHRHPAHAAGTRAGGGASPRRQMR